jgi:NADPH-dependent glutamate synthase beta subunit-like oxidoreductase
LYLAMEHVKNPPENRKDVAVDCAVNVTRTGVESAVEVSRTEKESELMKDRTSVTLGANRLECQDAKKRGHPYELEEVEKINHCCTTRMGTTGNLGEEDVHRPIPEKLGFLGKEGRAELTDIQKEDALKKGHQVFHLVDSGYRKTDVYHLNSWYPPQFL